MAYAARKTNLKNVVHIMFITTVMAVGGHTLFAPTGQVRADDSATNQITKDRLDVFYDASVKMQLAGENEAIKFFDKHLHKDYEGVMHVKSHIEGAPTQEQSVVLTKFEYLRDIRKAYRISTLEEVQSGMTSYNVSSDKRTAKVKDQTYTMSVVPMETSQGKSQTYNLRQYIFCEHFYTLNKKDVLQLKSSTCNVEGKMNKSFAL